MNSKVKELEREYYFIEKSLLDLEAKNEDLQRQKNQLIDKINEDYPLKDKQAMPVSKLVITRVWRILEKEGYEF